MNDLNCAELRRVASDAAPFDFTVPPNDAAIIARATFRETFTTSVALALLSRAEAADKLAEALTRIWQLNQGAGGELMYIARAQQIAGPALTTYHQSINGVPDDVVHS